MRKHLEAKTYTWGGGTHPCGKAWIDFLSEIRGQSFQVFVANELKKTYLDEARTLVKKERSAQAAKREVARIDDKPHPQAHVWLTVLPTDGHLRISWQDALDFSAWYFGVHIRERAPGGERHCRHPVGPESNSFCNKAYHDNDDHLCCCKRSPVSAPHNRVRDSLFKALRGGGFSCVKEARVPEFGAINGSNKTARLDIKIANWEGGTDPAFVDVSIRALLSQESEKSAGGAADALVRGDNHKKKTYPVVDPEGRLNVRCDLCPVVFSPWGGLSPEGTKFFEGLKERTNGKRTLRVRQVVAIEFVRSVAYKLRHGAGVQVWHPGGRVAGSDIRAVARGVPQVLSADFSAGESGEFEWKGSGSDMDCS